MSERVLELADQAFMSTLEHNQAYVSDQFCIYFAELIVERVFALLNDTESFHLSGYDEEHVRKYFGLQS